MQTATGGKFYPLDPRAEELCPIDIALSLSKQCRFAGHCVRYYSVAEHSVHVSRVLPPPLRLQGLLHDSTEAYVTDVIRPLKPYLTNLAPIEQGVWLKVAERWNLPVRLDPLVKQADNAVLMAEREQIMFPTEEDWSISEAPAPVTLQCWDPPVAARVFLAELSALTGENFPAEQLAKWGI